MTTRSSARRFTALLGGLAIVAGALATTTGAATAAASGPSISVSPHTGLADRDVVAISGAGFAPHHVVDVQQCAPTVGACRLATAVAGADGTGAFGRSLRVRRLVSRPDAPAVDCATTVCRIVATDQDNSASSASAVLAFDPTAPFSPPPTVTITPNTALPPATTVTVHGAGFARNALLEVSECVIGVPEESCIGLGYENSDASGGVDASARVTRLPFQTTVDCATAHCVLQVLDISRGDVAGTKLSFDPTIPVPTIALDPSGPLPFRGYVTAMLRHFTPAMSYTGSECYGSGGCGPEVTGVAGAGGDLQLRVEVRRIVPGITEDGPFPLDCATQGCFLRIEPADNNALESLSVRLTFDPNAPLPPPPTLTVAPATGLPYSATVHVTGAGYLAGSGVDLSECPSGPSPTRCRVLPTVRADAAGDIDTSVEVQRVPADFLPPGVDCAGAVGTCVVVAQQAGSIDPVERAAAGLGFDPTTAPPSVRVGSTTVRETDGPQFAQVPVTLSAPSGDPVSVHFTTYAYTAQAGTDYIAAPGTLVIPPGTTRGAIAIVVLGDTLHERPETLLVVIDQPVGATIADGNAVLTIHDDD